MDGLSAAASIFAVIGMSTKIFDLCQKYLSAVKDAKKDIQRLRNGVLALQDVLTAVRDLEDDPNASSKSIFAHLNQHNGLVQQCERETLEDCSRS